MTRQDLPSKLAKARQQLQKAQRRVAELEAQVVENPPTYSDPTGSDDEAELRLGEEMAANLSFAIDVTERDEQRQKAEDAVKRYAQRMEILPQIDRGIIQATSMGEIIDTALKQLRQIIPCQRANVGLVDHASGEGSIFAIDFEGNTQLVQGLRVPLLPDFFEGYDARHVKIVPDLRALQEVNPRFKRAVEEGLLSGMSVMMMDRDQPLGVLGLFANVPNFFTAEHQEIASQIASQLAIAIRQMQLSEELAHHTQTVEAMRSFLEITLDAIPAIIAVLDPDGTIIMVNLPWKKFAEDNGSHSTKHYRSVNYLTVCDTATGLFSEEATPAVAGIRAVIAGQQDDFYLEYPCHSPTEDRWFILRVTPFEEAPPRRVVVAHINITERRLAEKELNALYNATSQLFDADSLLSLGQQIVAAIVQEFDYADCGLMLIDRQRNAIMRLARTGDYNIQPQASLTLDGQGLVPLAIRLGEIVYVADVTHDPNYVANSDQTRSELVIPLKTSRGIIAIFDLQSAEIDAFSERDQRILTAYAERAAAALESMQLYEALNQHAAELEFRVAQRTAELQAAKERVEAILNNSADGILLVHRDFTIQQTNAAFDRLFACQADDYFKQSLTVIVQVEEVDRLRQVIQTGVMEEQNVTIELRARRQDATAFDAELSIGLITGDGFVVSIRDITNRKAQERRLQYYASLQENVSDAVIVTDMELRIQSWNRAAVRIYGWTAEEAIGQVAPDFLQIRFPSPSSHDAGLEQFNKHGSLQQETIQRRKDGTDIFILGSVTRLEDEKRNPIGIIAVNRDITARKSYERQLRYHASIQESVSDAVIVLDLEYCVQSWNKAAERIYGWHVDEVAGKPIGEILRTEFSSPQEREHILQQLQEQGWWEREVTQHHKDGRTLQILSAVSVLKDELGVQYGTVAVNRDITERKQAEATLQKSAAEIQDLYNNAPCGYHSIDKDGIIVQINDTELQWLGYTRDEVVGKIKVRELLTSESLQVFQKTFLNFIEQGWTKDIELDMVRKDGSIIHILLNATAIYDDNGQYLTSRSTLFDITERRQAEELLRESEERFRHAIINAPFPIMIHASDGEILHISNIWAELSGYSHEEIPTMKDWVEKAHRENAQTILAAIKNLYSITEAKRGGEFRVWTKSGKERVWDFISAPLALTPDGRRMVSSMAMDITERKRAEEVLRQSEERFALVFRFSPVAIGLTTVTEGRYLDVNDSLLKLLGYTRDEMIGHTSSELNVWGSPEEREIVIQTIREKGSVHGLEVGFRQKTGGTRTTLTSIVPVMLQGQSCLLSLVQDITERKTAEAAFTAKVEEERQFQSYLKALHEIVIDLTGLDNLDVFYKRAVELGRDQLGFERLALFLYNEQEDRAIGTFGTDAQGNLVDERQVRFKPDPNGIMQRSFEQAERFYFNEQIDLYYGETPVGSGWNAAAVLWNGTQSLGWFVADNLLSHKPASKALLDILGLYALSIGTLLAQKQAQMALKERERLYRLLAENISDLVMHSTLTSECLYVSPSVQALLGYTPDEMIGHQTFHLIHPDDRGIIAMSYGFALEQKAFILPHQYRARHKEGHYVWLETVGKPLLGEGPNEVLGVITSSRDISQRKQSEEALQESEEKYRSLVETMHSGLAVFDTEFRITYVNNRFCELLGYLREEVIGKHPINFVDDTTISLVQSHLERRQNAESTSYEVPLLHKDHHYIYVLLSGSPLFDKDGKYNGSFAIATDITIQKQAEDALRQSLAKEKELGDLKTRFVSMASHEFRTPLATILATVETLSAYRHRLSEVQVEQRFDKIKDQVSHLKDIMEDILLLARMQARRVEFNPVKLDLDALARSVLDEFESNTNIKHRLNYSITGNTTELILDRKLMRQIISNLVSNAIKYSSDEKMIQINLEYTASEVILSVSDEGIGIPEADLSHLFEPFHRAANVGAISGTGLGLVIIKEAVDLHGGTITVKSLPNIGTTFIVNIPSFTERQKNDENPNHRR